MASPLIIDVNALDDPRDAIHRAVQGLAEGKVVALPTESVYCLAAGGLNAKAVRRIREVRRAPADDAPVLAIKSYQDALDYVPTFPKLGLRLARRCWPGPLTLRLQDSHPDSLLHRLPEEVREAAVVNGQVQVTVPQNSVIASVLRLSPGPLVLWPACRHGEEEPVTAREAVERLDGELDLVIDEGRTRFGQSSTIVDVHDGGFRTARAGVISESALRQFASYMAVLVCTGNTCRSPMAETLLKKKLAEKLGCGVEELHERGIIVLSAGVNASPGCRASPEAVHIMRIRGGDLSQHESQPVNDRLVRMADLILTMTRSHRELLLNRWPEARDRSFLLSGERGDVADPIGGPVELYARCADQIEEYLEAWVERIAQHFQ